MCSELKSIYLQTTKNDLKYQMFNKWFYFLQKMSAHMKRLEDNNGLDLITLYRIFFK